MKKEHLSGTLDVIIPAFNEEDSIGGLVEEIIRIAGEGCRVIVVDDASVDTTAEKAAAAGARVIRHPYRIGNGGCLKTGLRQARADAVVMMDGDGQHRPEDIPRLLSGLARFDMAVGARHFAPWSWRNCANRAYTAFARYITRFPVQDLTSGFRAARTETVQHYLYLLPNGFSSPTTLTLAFLKSGRTLTYVPIPSSPRRHGTSKISVMEDGLRFFLIIVKVATFFSPMRVFLPTSAVFFLLGLTHYLYTFVFFHRFTNMSVLLFTTALVIFMLGLVSEQISQLRMDRSES